LRQQRAQTRQIVSVVAFLGAELGNREFEAHTFYKEGD